MRIIIIDLAGSVDERRGSINLISTMQFPVPIDFTFDYINNRLALALDFEDHPTLVDYLKTLPTERELQVVGGRFGRAKSGKLATSEWSGHYGEIWNDSIRDSFKIFMKDCGIEIVHREWDKHQTADQVG